MDVAIGFLILFLVAPAVYADNNTYVVGGTDGWALNSDLGNWVSGYTFRVTDKLLFNYQSPHSVDVVSSSAYQSCAKSNPIQSYNSGNDIITLNSTGTMYFICPTANHCSLGMKLMVTVSAASSTPATPTTPSSTPPSSTTTPSTTTPSTTTPSTTTPSTTSPSTTTPSSSTPSTTTSAGNLCNINALVLGFGVSIVYALMG